MKIAIGLVTHPASRFNAGGAASRQMNSIAVELRAQGLDVETLVSDQDDFDPYRYPLSWIQRLASARAQVNLENRWRSYVRRLAGEDRPGVRTSLESSGSIVRRSLAALHVPGVGIDTSRVGLTRLINIDLSHLRIWNFAIQVGADAVLVLEDDARLTSPDAAIEVLALLRALPREMPGFAVMSESLSPEDLGVASILERVHAFDSIRRLPFPLTNTVCANAYNAILLRSLVESITPESLIPVLPIDWRLNHYLLEHPETQCVWAEHPPFIQASMRPDG